MFPYNSAHSASEPGSSYNVSINNQRNTSIMKRYYSEYN